jgi:hypothetical protein
MRSRLSWDARSITSGSLRVEKDEVLAAFAAHKGEVAEGIDGFGLRAPWCPYFSTCRVTFRHIAGLGAASQPPPDRFGCSAFQPVGLVSSGPVNPSSPPARSAHRWKASTWEGDRDEVRAALVVVRSAGWVDHPYPGDSCLGPCSRHHASFAVQRRARKCGSEPNGRHSGLRHQRRTHQRPDPARCREFTARHRRWGVQCPRSVPVTCG